MGSLSIRNMNHSMGTMERVRESGYQTADLYNFIHAYCEKFGSNAGLELFNAKGKDFKATNEACRDILNGQKHGLVSGGALDLMNTSVSTGE